MTYKHIQQQKKSYYLINSDIIDIVVSRTNFVLVLNRGDVEVLLDVVHMVEGRHGGHRVQAKTGTSGAATLQYILNWFKSSFCVTTLYFI